MRGSLLASRAPAAGLPVLKDCRPSQLRLFLASALFGASKLYLSNINFNFNIN